MLSTVPSSALNVGHVGDSALQLNKTKGTSDFDWELQQALGPNFKVDRQRFPGEGAAAITQWLRGRGELDIVIPVWMLNEAFRKDGTFIEPYPPMIDALALDLARELKRFRYVVAVLGGSAQVWNAPDNFDAYAARVKSIFQHQGIQVVDGLGCYGRLKIKDGWHASSNDENKYIMGHYFAQLVRGAATANSSPAASIAGARMLGDYVSPPPNQPQCTNAPTCIRCRSPTVGGQYYCPACNLDNYNFRRAGVCPK